jgi:hypothetical protein
VCYVKKPAPYRFGAGGDTGCTACKEQVESDKRAIIRPRRHRSLARLWWDELCQLQEKGEKVPLFFQHESAPHIVGLISAHWGCPREKTDEAIVSLIPSAQKREAQWSLREYSYSNPDYRQWEDLEPLRDERCIDWFNRYLYYPHVTVGGAVAVMRFSPGDRFHIIRRDRWHHYYFEVWEITQDGNIRRVRRYRDRPDRTFHPNVVAHQILPLPARYEEVLSYRRR